MAPRQTGRGRVAPVRGGLAAFLLALGIAVGTALPGPASATPGVAPAFAPPAVASVRDGVQPVQYYTRRTYRTYRRTYAPRYYTRRQYARPYAVRRDRYYR